MIHRILRPLVWALALLAGLVPSVPAEAGPLKPSGVVSLLRKYCFECHGKPDNFRSDLKNILDLPALIRGGYLIPGKPEESLLWLRVSAADPEEAMPPSFVRNRPSAGELGELRQWILEGAPIGDAGGPRTVAPETASPEKTLELVRRDLDGFSPAESLYQRYFSFRHLLRRSPGSVFPDTYRAALTRLVNYLSWKSTLVIPVAVDGETLLFRVDLRDLGWTVTLWTALKADDPYFGQKVVAYASPAPPKALLTAAQVVRGDWFLENASQGERYGEFLNLPPTDAELEARLGVFRNVELMRRTAFRAGFARSGTEANNRLIERNQQRSGGFYWRSYNFESNLGDANIFSRTLLSGLPGFPKLNYADSDILFELPNGLHGYLTVDGEGKRTPDLNARAGLRCLECHSGGMILNHDQVRASVLDRPNLYPPETRKLILDIYGGNDTLVRQLTADDVPFKKAVASLQLPTNLAADPRVEKFRGDPVNAAVGDFQSDVSLETAAAELGATSEQVLSAIHRDRTLEETLGSLLLEESQGPGWGVVRREWDPLESTCRHASLSIL